MADAKEDVKGAVQDLLDSRREFTLETPENEILHFFIASPTGEDIRKADWQYSKVYNQAIVDGLLTQAQMLEILQEKGIINESYTEKLEMVRISLGAELFKLEALLQNASAEQKEVTAMEVARLRDELFQLNQRVNGPMSNTCENLAEDARTDFLTSRVVQKKDGTRVWKDFESYRNEENTALAVKARFEVMLWMQGLESNFLENTPEQTVLRNVAQQRLEQAMSDRRAAGESSPSQEVISEEVENLELPEETPAAPKKTKKRGRPKGSKGKAKKDE